MITPHERQDELAQELGLNPESSPLYFKREDLHPYGSHKGRSLPLMIDEKMASGCRHFVISSSGNAALAAALHVKKLNENGADITLEIFAGKNIKTSKLEKLEALRDSHILLSIQERPLQAVFTKTQDPSIQSLRQSTDPAALLGYRTLAAELLEIPDLASVFMGTSSGTTAQALAEYFAEHGKEVEVHIVQTSSCHPLAEVFVDNYSSEEKSIADAIVDQTALRKEILIPLIEKSGGSGWIASNEEIVAAQDMVQKTTGLNVSPNSALSVAGLMQAVYTGRNKEGAIVCMVCGE